MANLDHEAIRKAYSDAVTIDGTAGAFDKDGSNYFGADIGNRTRGWQLANYGDSNTGESVAFQFLDSPSTTSQITYDVRIKAQASTATVNMSGSDNNNANFGYRSASVITAMEVAA